MHSKHLTYTYNTPTSFKSVSVRGVRDGYKGEDASTKTLSVPQES